MTPTAQAVIAFLSIIGAWVLVWYLIYYKNDDQSAYP